MYKKRIKTKNKYYNKHISIRETSQNRLYALMKFKNRYSEIVVTPLEITVKRWKLGHKEMSATT